MIIKYPKRKAWSTHRADCYCNTCFKHKCIKKKSTKQRIITDYFEYMQSAQWNDRKRKYYAIHKKECKACGTRTAIDLHHLVYGNFGSEPDIHLVPLCKVCHKDFHTKHGVSGNMIQATKDYIKERQNKIKTLIKIMST
jgi:5-methylcytosine-specific restriction endonuclease McrA